MLQDDNRFAIDGANGNLTTELQHLPTDDSKGSSGARYHRDDSLDSSRAQSPISSVSSLVDTNDDYIALDGQGHTPRWLHRSPGELSMQIDAMIQRSRLLSWLDGPSTPRWHAIDTLSPKTQAWLSKLVSTRFPGRSTLLVSAPILLAWLLIFTIMLSLAGRRNAAMVNGRVPLSIDCTTQLWPNTTYCGLDGEKCRPFNDTAFPIICPSGCASVQVLEPHTIGGQQVNYHPMVIGGPQSDNQEIALYRGDSWVCQAAIHAGILDDRHGGCAMLARQGEHGDYVGSVQNGIESIHFEPRFPLSFSLSATQNSCGDPQWALFALSVSASTMMSLLTSSAGFFFAATFVILYFQIALASDAPFQPDISSMLSLAFERFLPSAFIAWVLYRYCVRRCLHELDAHLERTVLWLGGCWIGAMNNYTFDKIPISRLTPHDLQQQPGAITALVTILLVIIIAATGQAWAFWNEGRLRRYLAFYLALGVLIGCLAALPGLNLRLHHYIIALLLLPGTSLQTRPSLLYQGILLGLFINGTARWGYASIVQTTDALRGDAQLGSALPRLSTPSIGFHSVSFTLQEVAKGFDGVSVLVNDVERFRQSQITLPFSFNWTRDITSTEPTFFRFAFTGLKPLGGSWYGDYTKPGTWFPNGTWGEILPGPSK